MFLASSTYCLLILPLHYNIIIIHHIMSLIMRIYPLLHTQLDHTLLMGVDSDLYLLPPNHVFLLLEVLPLFPVLKK